MSQNHLYVIENRYVKCSIDDRGNIVSLLFHTLGEELIKEPLLANSFKINLPLPGQLNHYITGAAQRVAIFQESGSRLRIHCDSLLSGSGEFPIQADFFVELVEERIEFSYVIDNGTEYPLAEIWYPMIGGLTGIGDRMDTESIAPGYTGEINIDVFRKFSGQYLGNEDACKDVGYPGITMPWVSIYNKKRNTGLYAAEYNEIQRKFSFVFQLTPNFHTSSGSDNWPSEDEVPHDTPIGLILSKVAYPHTKAGRFESGLFILQAHEGDWHRAAKIYRGWFLDRFPVDKTASWLRKEHAWFSSVIYQPEDRVIATHDLYAEWMKDAMELGIMSGELIGWDKGGLERDYPEYVPEEKLGGWDGYRNMVQQIHENRGKLLTFVNYHILDACTEWFRRELHRYQRMDSFGHTENWMAWGESTLKATAGLDVRRHYPASVSVPGFTELLDSYLTKLVEEGSDALQIDKLCVNGQLDFNPNHHYEPDLPMCEHLVKAVEKLYWKCKAINPEFCLASETNTDRYIPFVDVFYRCATERSISTLRYAFPEWTSCVHASSPFDYAAVNGAVMLGAVLVVEPFAYTRPVSHPVFEKMGRYIQECLRIRKAYEDRIFLADYLDRIGVDIVSESKDNLHYRVHARYADGKRAVVVLNDSRTPLLYRLRWEKPAGETITVVQPFHESFRVSVDQEFELAGERFHIFLE